jgi:hypothetical protein
VSDDPEDTREERPADADYYEARLNLLSQGDIFDDVPLAYPIPPDTILDDERFGGARRYLAGPLEYGRALLITPTCNMRSQGAAPGTDYAHPVRTLVPLVPLDEGLRQALKIDDSKYGMLKKYDELLAYMYLPAAAGLGVPESLAFLYMPITLHHDMVVDQRVTQLAAEGARQLHRKLVWFISGIRQFRAAFTPPLD